MKKLNYLLNICLLFSTFNVTYSKEATRVESRENASDKTYIKGMPNPFAGGEISENLYRQSQDECENYLSQAQAAIDDDNNFSKALILIANAELIVQQLKIKEYKLKQEKEDDNAILDKKITERKNNIEFLKNTVKNCLKKAEEYVESLQNFLQWYLANVANKTDKQTKEITPERRLAQIIQNCLANMKNNIQDGKSDKSSSIEAFQLLLKIETEKIKAFFAKHINTKNNSDASSDQANQDGKHITNTEDHVPVTLEIRNEEYPVSESIDMLYRS